MGYVKLTLIPLVSLLRCLTLVHVAMEEKEETNFFLQEKGGGENMA